MAMTATAAPGERVARRRHAAFFWAVPALVLILLFFVTPVLGLLLRSVTEPTLGLQNYAELIGTGTYARIFANTFLVAGVVTALSVVIGYPVAWALAVLPRQWGSWSSPSSSCPCGPICWRVPTPGWCCCSAPA